VKPLIQFIVSKLFVLFFVGQQRRMYRSAKQNSPNLKNYKSSVLLGKLYLLFKQWLMIFCTLKQYVKELQRELMVNVAVIIKGMYK